MTRLSRAMWGEGKGEEKGKRREPGAAAIRPKVQKEEQVTEMSGSYREEPLGGRAAQPLGWIKCREGGGVCGPEGCCGRTWRPGHFYVS